MTGHEKYLYIHLQAKIGDSINCTSLSISVRNSIVISNVPLQYKTLRKILDIIYKNVYMNICTDVVFLVKRIQQFY